MRSAQMCRIMLAVSLTFTLFQPLRAAAQGEPSPTFQIPPKHYNFVCEDVGKVTEHCYLDMGNKLRGFYDCKVKGPFENYKKDRQDRIGTLQGELLPLAEDEGVQSRKMQQAQHDIKLATTNPALTAAQFAYAEAEKKLKKDQSDSVYKLKEIKLLQDEMDHTDTSYKIQCTKCEEGFYLDPTGKCQCTTERQNRAIEENLRGGPAWQTVCGGGQSR